MRLVERVKVGRLLVYSTCITVMSSMNAFAAPGGTTADLDATVNFIADWVGKFGLIVAFIGGVQTALAFKNDDADAKTKGIRTLVAGFMVFGISKSLSLFGL